MIGKENNDWYLQEDNDPKHMSKKCQEWKQLNNIKKIPWSAHSPDCNPMENVWALIKGQINGKKFLSTSALIQKVRRIWKGLDESYSTRLVEILK